MQLGQVALFLDRDGTLIVHKPYLIDPSEVELTEGAAAFCQEAQKRRCLLFLFTNQSAVGRGYCTVEAVHACNRRMETMLGVRQTLFKEICIAPEHPEGPQNYRKPSPKFILEMVKKYHLDPKQCSMIGDNLADLQAAIAAKIGAVHIESSLVKDPDLAAYKRVHGIPTILNLTSFWDL